MSTASEVRLPRLCGSVHMVTYAWLQGRIGLHVRAPVQEEGEGVPQGVPYLHAASKGLSRRVYHDVWDCLTMHKWQCCHCQMKVSLAGV